MDSNFVRISCDYYNKEFIKYIQCEGNSCYVTIKNTERVVPGKHTFAAQYNNDVKVKYDINMLNKCADDKLQYLFRK
jgi:hypothetical protein